MKKKKNIIALNISENQITCAVCSIDDKEDISVSACSTVAARGVESGAISDLSDAASSIAQAVEKAELQARNKITSLVANCDGASLRGYNAKGNVTIADNETEITRRDIERVRESARTIALPFDREIVHSICRGFIIDGQSGIKNPSGMFGVRLEVDMQIVTSLISNLHNLRRAINMAGFEINDIVLSGIAAGHMVIDDLEKDLGVILIYISYSAVQIVVYNSGEIKSIEVVPTGSGAIIEKIAADFKMPRDYAEVLLKREAVLDKSLIGVDDKILFKVGSSQRSISKADLYDSIEPKAKDLLEKISQAVREAPFAKEASAGCVTVGELADISGFLEMLELSLNMPVKMGLAKDISGKEVCVGNPGQIICFGLVKHWAQNGAKRKLRKNIFGNSPVGKIVDRARDILSDYF